MVRDKLAEFEHEQWLSWVSYLFKYDFEGILEQLQARNIEGALQSFNALMGRLKPYVTPYNQLPESMKERYRKYADRILKIISSSTQANPTDASPKKD